jgi:putative DNA methylase
LGKLQEKEKFDLIVTDPPYYDDVPYTDYGWLKRCLEGKLVPKYLPDVFFRKIENRYIEIKTQWEEFATKEVS